MTVIMYAAPLKDCKWNDTQVVDIVKHVNIFCSLLSKTKCVHQWLYIKQGTILCAFYFMVSVEWIGRVSTIGLYVCTAKCKKTKLTFQWCHNYRGISDVSSYTAGANARCFHIWMRPETDLRISESMRFFSWLHGRGPFPICATWEEINQIWVTWTMQCKCGLSDPTTVAYETKDRAQGPLFVWTGTWLWKIAFGAWNVTSVVVKEPELVREVER